MPDSTVFFSADVPLTHPDQDELGYAPFAQQLALVMAHMAPTNGLVVSVNGAWGSGKSTVLNSVVHYLEELANRQRPTVLRFSPWWFSGHEDLTRLMIAQLSAHLTGKGRREIRVRLADLGELVSGISGLPLSKLLEFISKRLRDQPDLPALKGKIDKLLRAQNRKILVVIDDVDRLAPDQIRHLFRAVKAVAGFANVIYLLAFDTKVVTQALESEFQNPGSGEDYLEKIVQVPFELPPVDRFSLRRLLFRKLEIALADTPDGLFDMEYWVNVFFDGLDCFFRTPRDVARVVNVLHATYPAVRGEVNPVDYVAVEALRVFAPEVYDIVRNNRELLAGLGVRAYGGQDDHKRRAIYEGWLEHVNEYDQETVRRLLARLFPLFDAAFSNVHHGFDFLDTWYKQQRVCSPDVFETYFRFSVPPDAITPSEMRALLDEASDAGMFGASLIRYASQSRRDGTTRLRGVLERLEDYTQEDVPLADIPSIVGALFHCGDQLLSKQDEPRGLLDFGNDIRIGRVLHQLLSRLSQMERFELLESAIRGGEALSVSVGEVVSLGQEHGKFGGEASQPEAERTVSGEQLAALEQLVLGKIREAAADGTLLAAPKLVSALSKWKAWSGNDDEVRIWVSGITETDEALARFVEHFGSFHRVLDQRDLVPQSVFRLDPERLAPFIDPSSIATRVRMLAGRTDLPDDQLRAAQQFCLEYDLRQEGRDPAEALRANIPVRDMRRR